MNIELNTLLKTILDQAEEKFLSLEDAKRIFLLRYQQNQDTKNYYIKNLRKMYSLLDDYNINYTNQITTTIIQKVAQTLLKKVQPQTVNKYIESLFTMLKYLSNDLEIIDMPKIKYEKLKENDFEGSILSEDEVRLVYHYIESKSIRTRLIVKLIMETGIRRTEITKIKIKNVNLKEETIFLQNLDTKACRSRYLFLLDDTMDLLKDYLEAYNPKVYLFECSESKHISSSAISSIFERMKKDLNLNDLSPHVLRRTFATYMLDAGANINSVKNLLGHSTLSQTQKYVIATKKQLKRDCMAYNPKHLLKNKE